MKGFVSLRALRGSLGSPRASRRKEAREEEAKQKLTARVGAVGVPLRSHEALGSAASPGRPHPPTCLSDAGRAVLLSLCKASVKSCQTPLFLLGLSRRKRGTSGTRRPTIHFPSVF